MISILFLIYIVMKKDVIKNVVKATIDEVQSQSVEDEIYKLDKDILLEQKQNDVLKKRLQLARLRKENRDMVKEMQILENDWQPLFI